MWTKRLAAIVMFFIVVCLASGMALAQGTGHTVSDGETLWGLAGRYYNNPWQWKKIYEANRDKINDPHWIYPAQEFSIPGMVAEGVAPEQAVTAETPPAEVTTTGPYGETAVAETSP
ncbi:MAG: LysM peptidoglycan-binding domain-containing protein, partial [Elusimicrobiota bacterium]